MPSSRQQTFRRPQPTVLPDIEPIIPVERATAFNDPAWVFEPKHDGFRGLAYLTPDGCVLHSKRGHRFKRFGSLCRPLRELVAARTAILDGEVLALDAEGRPQFIDLLRGKGRLAFAAFEILWLDGGLGDDAFEAELTATPPNLSTSSQRTRGKPAVIPHSVDDNPRIPCPALIRHFLCPWRTLHEPRFPEWTVC
jgi:hypothetical protein